MVKMENDVVISLRRFLDGIYSKWKLGDNILFDQWNNNNWNIEPALGLGPSTF